MSGFHDLKSELQKCYPLVTTVNQILCLNSLVLDNSC